MGPIHRAVMEGNLMRVRQLVAQQPEVVDLIDTRNLFMWRTPLHIAADRGHHAVVLYLIDHGANINFTTSPVQKGYTHGRTALHLACDHGHSRVVTILMERGADSSIRDSLGFTPMIIATRAGAVGCVNRLLCYHAARITIDTPDHDGKTPLSAACLRSHKEIVRLLLHAGADPALADKDGQTPMDIVRGEEDERCMRLLVVSGGENSLPKPLS